MGSLLANANLVKKVWFPRQLLVASTVASFGVSFLIELAVLSVALLIAGNMVLPWILPVLGVALIQAAFVLGIALAFAVWNVYFRDLEYLVGIGLQLWFYSTPVVYTMDLVEKALDDREGLPITLAILLVELGRAIGVSHLDPTLTPGHMLVRHSPPGEPLVLMDPFDGGKLLSHEEVGELVEATTGARFRGEHLRRSGPVETISRLLTNLMGVAEQSGKPETGLHYLDLIVTLNPDAAIERLQRGMLRLRMGDNAGAREDLSWLLEAEPLGLDLERIAELLRTL